MSSLLVLLPLVIPLGAAATGLLLRRRRQLQRWWSVGAMAMSFAACSWVLWRVWQTGVPMVYQVGGWRTPFGISIAVDLLGAFMAFMSQGILVAGLLYALGARDRALQYPTFYPLFLTLATGLTGAFYTGDIFNLFVFTELLVLSGAALTAMSDDRNGVEASLKYLYMSLLASWFMLLAIGSLYTSYGTLNYADLAQRIAAAPDKPLLAAAIAFLFATFMVKSAVFPFHFWQPDFHTVSPTAVSAMLSSVVVKLGVYGFLRMTLLWFPAQAAVLQMLLVILGVAGVIYGGLAALGTYNAKRMLAYSTLAQIGFILVAVGWGTPLALTAAIVIMFNHSVIKAAMLMLAGAVASRAPVKTADFAMVTGLGKTFPGMGALFLVGGLALAGIPPTNGFISKALLFDSGLRAEQFAVLALIGMASLLTLIYTTRAFMRIWWEAPKEGARAKPYGDRLLAPALLIVIVLGLGLWPEPLLRLASDIALSLADMTPYFQAVAGG